MLNYRPVLPTLISALGVFSADAQQPDGDWRMANSTVSANALSQELGWGIHHGET